MRVEIMRETLKTRGKYAIDSEKRASCRSLCLAANNLFWFRVMSEGRRSLPARMPELYEEYEERDTPSTHPLRREARGAHFHHTRGGWLGYLC